MTECHLCAKHDHQPDADHTNQCIQREADVGQVCRKCLTRIAHNLDMILECWALTTIPPWPTQGGDGRAKTQPLPGSTEWIDYRHGAAMFGALTAWIDCWVDTLNLPGPKTKDLANLIGWLRRHLEHAAHDHPALQDFAAEISQLARRGRTMAGLTQHRGLEVSCPTDDCGHTIRVDARDQDAEVTCKHCKRTWSAATLLNLTNYHDAWVDVDTASRATKVPEATLRRWAKAGKVERRRGQYRLESIRERIKPVVA